MWEPEDSIPDLVVISLGGNDYNHQGGNVPSDAEFSAGYEELLLKIFTQNSEETKVAAICGMGDPTELARDPDNDRCSPCPHVQDAITDFQEKYGDQYDLTYVDIPCDGTVVTGIGDIGCSGHKNHEG